MGPRTQDDQGMPPRHPSHARSTLLGVRHAHPLLPVALLGPLPCESWTPSAWQGHPGEGTANGTERVPTL